jgi:iron(III) transport system substrate-binding protein
VRYAGTAELAVLLQEEGDATPADRLLGPGPRCARRGRRAARRTARGHARTRARSLRDADGRWIATSGRQRVIVYSTERVAEDEMPASITELTDERYRGRVGWAPTNGSFQLHVTALRETLGEEETRAWLEAMIANEPVVFSNNTAIVQGVADGEADIGLTNNYYLPRFLASDPEFPVRVGHFEDGDIGNLLAVAAIGITSASDEYDEAVQFVEFLLSPQAQQYFAGSVYEYPVTQTVILRDDQPTLESLSSSAPQVDLNDLSDLEGTLELLREVGLL